jgi:hypothetical protein
MLKVGGTIWDDDAAAEGLTWTGGGWGTSPWPSCRNLAFDSMRLCFPRGSGILYLGSESENVCHQLKTDLSDQTPKGQTSVRLTRTSSIQCIICLHRQKGVHITIAYRRWAFLRVSSLRRAWGQKFVTTIFAKNMCIGANAPVLIWEWALSSPYGRASKKSRR